MSGVSTSGVRMDYQPFANPPRCLWCGLLVERYPGLDAPLHLFADRLGVMHHECWQASRRGQYEQASMALEATEE